jgi:hypothetical protein
MDVAVVASLSFSSISAATVGQPKLEELTYLCVFDSDDNFSSQPVQGV